MINLQPFCSIDPKKKNILNPWSTDDFSFATDGLILIRVPRLDNILTDVDALTLKNILPDFDKTPIKWYLIEKKILKKHKCDKCRGYGYYHICPECGGECYVEFENDYNEYYNIDCKTCEGRGGITPDEYIDLLKKHKMQIDADKCLECSGTGKIFEHTSTNYGNAFFADPLLHKLYDLPNCEIGPFEKHDAARFQFDGGDGLIMPIRVE